MIKKNHLLNFFFLKNHSRKDPEENILSDHRALPRDLSNFLLRARFIVKEVRDCFHPLT